MQWIYDGGEFQPYVHTFMSLVSSSRSSLVSSALFNPLVLSHLVAVLKLSQSLRPEGSSVII